MTILKAFAAVVAAAIPDVCDAGCKLMGVHGYGYR
jgi:hypothetical protein